jgi:putative peptide zinc metalloprotease protein
MSQPITSSQWYRVSDLHPRLRSHVRVQRQIYRNEVWYLLADGLRGRTHRVNRVAYDFIGRCDGELPVQELWESLLQAKPDEAPSQDEVIELLVQLNQRGLLQCEQTPDVEQLFRAEIQERKQSRLQAMNPLAFRVGLFDPTALLKRFDAITPYLFSLGALLAWLLIVGAGLLAAAANWPALKAHAANWMPGSQAILLTWLAFPVIKAVHELAHGLAVRRWSGEVHQAGITLLMLTPVPFVDASDASAFPRHYRRLVVSAAGIMLELVLAALAVLLWTQVQPGLVRDLCLVVASIGGISTVVFNGNPLLRFDGYYMLTDAIHLPNLASRSSLYWRYLIVRHALRLADTPPPDTAKGEKAWLIAYAPLSWAYRVALSIVITGWIGSWSPILGILVALGSLWSLLLKPWLNFFRSLRRRPAPEHQQRRVKTMAAAWALALVLFVGVLPLPFSTLAQGVVWVPENALVRPESGGFIKAFHARDGQSVAIGDRLASLSDPALLAEGERLRNEILQKETELYRLILSDQVAASNLQTHLDRLAAELQRTEQRIAQLEIRAAVAGRLAMPHQADIEGSYAPQGKALGYIITDDPTTVRVAISQDAAALVQSGTRSISVRLAEAPGNKLAAEFRNATPAASDRLPSAALSDHSAGPHVADPGDKEHLKSREQLFVFDLGLPTPQGDRIGGRAWVRFEHAATPLAMQWARRLQQLLLHTFNPNG